MKINIYLCEGPHDVAFFQKIFNIFKYKDLSGIQINKLPSPFDKYFESILKTYKYENGNIFGKPSLPTILKSDEDYILIYGVGGIDKVNVCKNIIEDFIAFLNSPNLNKDNTTKCSISFIIDADKEGIEKRNIEIKNRYSDILLNINDLEHNNYIENEFFTKIGLYIFANTNDYGNLEDIIFPIMKKENEKIFDDAELFFDNNFEASRLKKTNNVDKSKSLIGIAGQLQFSGIANNNIIRQTDYLTNEKILDNPKCKEIIEFIEKMKI